MAQKKKASAARIATVPSSQEEILSSSTPDDGAEVPSSENGGRASRRRDEIAGKPETGDTLIRGECEKALVALRRGNSNKALRLIKDACSRNESSGLAHRVQGHIFMRLASIIEDANAKQRHAASALESARIAVELSPQSVEYAHFYAQLLYDAAKDSTGYEEVIGVCEKALLIEHPIDPARESLQNEQQQDLPTAEARIEHVHQELKSLLQKANNISHLPSSISTWMKTLGNGTGEDKLRFVQMRGQDLMEQKVSQPKRPHEVKKVVKTPEERRKEIEVRVAAARLLQQRDSSAGADSPEDTEKSLQKKLDRRKSRLSKPLTTDERIDRVRVFWHSLSREKRESLLQVTVAELKEHALSVKSSDALSEALEFAQENKTWRFWACCQCGTRFASVQEFHHHTSEHIGTLPPHIRHYLSEYAQASGVGFLSEGLSAETGEDDMIQDRLMLTEDFSELLLDERVVKETPEEMEGPAAHRPLLPLMKGEQHVDRQLSWIFGSAEYEYQPSGWKQFREEQGQRGRDMYRSLENEFQRLLALCTKRFELVSSEEALNLVERTCVVEKNRRAQQFDTGKDLEAVLKDRQQELLHLRRVSLRNGGLSFAQESELDAIGSVLKDVQTSTVRRLLYSGISNDSDEDDEEAWRTQKSSNSDFRVEAVIARQREHLSIEANVLDPKIMRATDDFQRLEVKLRQFAVLDYRAVALPLVKSLLQSRLEGEAEKDAMQKSDAAREAFLAELAKDEKSSGSKDVENVKQARGKAKEKRKPKDQKKLKDVKRAPSNPEQLGESASMKRDEGDDLDKRGLVAGDDSKEQLETEIQHQALLLEEERKLLEALEFQRRLEEETKQKHLDELERKKQTSLEIVLPLEDGAHATNTVDDPKILPTSSLEPLSVESACQDLEVAEQINLPSEHIGASPSLPAQDEQSRPDQILEDPPRIEPAEDHACNKVVEKEAPAEVMQSGGTNGSLKEDSDHQKKTRGGNNRNRRRKGPRIYAEEGIIADQNVSPWKTSDVANGPRAIPEDNATKTIETPPSVDQPKPLLRQNASRKFGVAPANGVNVELPLLLLPAPEGFGGNEGKKTLRQLQAEQDDEERFQADLEQALRQSLDMLTSLPTGPSSLASPSPIFSNSSGILREYEEQQLLETRTLNGAVETPVKEVEEVGKGLRNENGQYNCFLNVVIQSLWHLRRFREELLADSSMQHVHVGDPCVVCALRNVFLGLNTPAQNTSSKDAVAPTALRVALSALYSDSDFFQEAQMNDASEVLAVIFDCLHKAFVPNSSSDGDSESSTAGGSWDCQGQQTCMAHALFGLNIAEQMNCQSCGLESRHLKYTAFFHNINASALRTAKLLYPDSSMDELIKLVDMNHQLACDTETGGCGRSNHIHHFLHAVPPVFTTVLGWQNGRESFEDIAATVDAMDAALDVAVIYRGLDEGFQHRLVSVVCYYGQHYHCFAYNREHSRWVMFDDSTVKVIGDWKDVTSTCRRGHLQPQVLFYEAVRSDAVTQLLPVLNMPWQS